MAGASTRCRACGFVGETEEFPVATTEAPFGGVDAVFNMFAQDIKNAVAQDIAVPIGRILVKYGFISNPPTVPEMSMYLSTIAKALAESMIKTREADVIAKVRKQMAGDQSCN